MSAIQVPPKVGTPYQLARTKREQARAEREVIKLALEQGKLIPVETVEAFLEGPLMAVRSRILAQGTRLAARLTSQPEARVIKEAIDAANHEALAELAQLNIDRLQALAQEAGAAAQIDAEPVGGSGATAQPRKQRRARPVGHPSRRVSARDHGRDHGPDR